MTDTATTEDRYDSTNVPTSTVTHAVTAALLLPEFSLAGPPKSTPLIGTADEVWSEVSRLASDMDIKLIDDPELCEKILWAVHCVPAEDDSEIVSEVLGALYRRWQKAQKTAEGWASESMLMYHGLWYQFMRLHVLRKRRERGEAEPEAHDAANATLAED